MKGCIILPTGAGKTALGIKAIQMVNASTLVVVPTIELMDQWAKNISRHIVYPDDHDGKNLQNIQVGLLGGGQDDLQAITIATYDSAYIRAPILAINLNFNIRRSSSSSSPRVSFYCRTLIAPCRLGLSGNNRT